MQRVVLPKFIIIYTLNWFILRKMGLLTILKKLREKEKEMRVLVLGLDNAGKSTILQKALGKPIDTIPPTFGFNIETLERHGRKLNVWDVGGQKSLRSYWRNYFEDTEGVIWVVDSTDKRRLMDCKKELHNLLKEERLLGCSLLIFANKQDLDGALTVQQITALLDLKKITSHHWLCLPCSARLGTNLLEGIDWLIEDIVANKIDLSEDLCCFVRCWFCFVNRKAMRDQVKKSGAQSMSLCDLLKEADLGNYLSALQLQLKVLHAEHLRFVTETDLADIGMSKPEQRRLLKTFQKHFPDSYLSKLRQKLLGKVLPLPVDDDSQTLPKAQPSVSSQKTEQHIIPAENIQLCQNLGSGEFASVWRGVWAMSGNGGEKVQVAVKKILPEKMHSNPLDFLQEAAIMHRVNHEHIVRFYGVVLNPKSVMLVTELAPLRSLVECLRQPAFRPSFTVPRLCDYIEQICAGMAYLEANRLIHRDLAARNILVFSLELVKVADFGLSRALGAGEEYYHSNVSFTSASDVWSFGVTMWELFTYGFQPWAGLTGQQILDCVNTPKSQRLEAPDACPVDHYNLMLQCWEHEPSKRPKFAELIQLLPEIEPDRLRAITEVDDGEPDHLQYKVDTVITVLNKRPSEYPDGYYWKGVLNTGRTGLFLPETTISQLNSECPSLAGTNDKSMSWSSSSLSSCLPTGAVPSVLATGKRRNVGGKRHQRNGGGIRWPTTAALLSKAARLKENETRRLLNQEEEEEDEAPIVGCRPSVPPRQQGVDAVKPLSYNDSKMLVDLTNLAVELADKALRVENERLKQIVSDAQQQQQQQHWSSTTAGRDSPKSTDQNSNGSSPSSAKKWLTDSLRKLSRERDSVEGGDVPTFCSRLPPQGEVKLSAESESAYKSMVECLDDSDCGGDGLMKVSAASLRSESGEPTTVGKCSQQGEHGHLRLEQEPAAEEEEETNPLRLLRDGGPQLLKRLRSNGRPVGKIPLAAQSSNDDDRNQASPPPVPPRILHRSGIGGGSGQSLVDEDGGKKPIPPPVPPKTVSCRGIVRAMRDQLENFKVHGEQVSIRALVTHAVVVVEIKLSKRLVYLLFLTLLSCNGIELNTTSEELIASPIYELELQLHEGITKKIEIESGQAFALRCIDSTGTLFHSENLLWLRQGKRLRDSTINKIKIKNTRKFSVLIVDFFEDSMSGLYECVLRRKDKVMKSRIHYVNLFEEELCTAEKQDFCTNGGTCLYHRPTGTYNCKCPPQYVGRMCEYLESLIISSRQNPALEPSSLHRTQTILICSVMGIFFAMACCCYFCYVKKSEKLSAQRNDRQTKSLESLLECVGENKKRNWPEYSISNEALRIRITEKQDKSERSPSKCANDENHSSFQDHINEQNCFINRSLNKNFDTLKNPKNNEYTNFSTVYCEISVKLIYFSCILLNFILFFLSRFGHVVITDSTRKQAISFSGISPLRTTISTAYTN
ncbi:Tyrosine-protein kinase PR2 [Trichinella sp. T8]|nr:Tyrosine-protein kinase PR2 [Trichinella sp. T8]